MACLRCRARRSGRFPSLPPLGAGEKLRGWNPQHLADAGKHIHGRRLVVIFEKAEVGAVDPRRNGNLFLRQIGSFTGFFQLGAEIHPGRVRPLRF